MQTARLLVFLAAWAVATGAPAAGLTVTVTSVDDEPVEHAAVLLHAEGDTSAHADRPRIAIDQQGQQFQPWVAAIPRGGEIVFSNHDDITHHVYSFSPAKRISFRLRSGERHAPLEMDETGVVIVGCNIHDWMVGYIHVSDATYTATTDESGHAVFDDLPAGTWRASIWHPGLEDDALPEAQLARLSGDASTRIDFRLTAPLSESGPQEPLEGSGYGPP